MTVTIHPQHPHRLTASAQEIVPPQGYRTPAWYDARSQGISASDIAVVLGISPYQSPFDLWYARKYHETGQDRITEPTEKRRTSRGRRVEPLVIEDFEDEHPDLVVRAVGLAANNERPWQMATPDSLAYEREWSNPFAWWEGDPVAVVEAKTAGGSEGFGTAGTDQIPLHYRAQVLWQMDVLGLPLAYMPVWVGFDYRCYVIEYDPADAEFMRQAAVNFLASVEGGEPPPLDGHPATTRRLKKLHPTVLPGSVEVPETLILQYHAAKRLRDAAQQRMDLARNRLRDALGDYQKVMVNGRKVASRSVYEMGERTVHYKASTVNKLTISKPQDLHPPQITQGGA